MTSQYSSASVLAGRGAANIIDLHTHPNFSTRQRRRKFSSAMRVFVGPNAARQANAWILRHGEKTALAVELDVDPASIKWPERHALVLVPSDVRLTLAQAVAFALAWQRDGVVYGHLPHELHRPNVWWLASRGAAA